MSNTDLISIEKIEKAIYIMRGEKVMLDPTWQSFTRFLRKRPTFGQRSCRAEPVTVCDRFTEAPRSAFKALRFY